MRLKNPEVRIENTNRCNAHCVICPRTKMTRPLATMPYAHFGKLVLEADELGAEAISIFGYGEPLLDDGLAKKVKLCTKLGLRTNLTTNASLLTASKISELLAAGLSQIRFSVHGFGTNYEKVHRGLRWFNVIGNINAFISENNANGHECEVHVTTIPMHNEKIKDIVSRWKPGEGEVDYLEVWRPHNWAGGKNYRSVTRRKKTCGRPFNGPVQINADGKVMVCCFDFNAEMEVGDTNYQTIEEIVKGNDFEVIRAKHWEGSHYGLPCETCDQLNVYNCEDNPLLYSNRDKNRELGKTSSCKIKLEEN